LRTKNIAAEIGYSGNVKKRLERANKFGAAFAVLVDDNLTLKNLVDGSQREIAVAELTELLK
jgi:histidyl-tRNA synthetase